MRRCLQKQLPLRLREAEVLMGMMPREAAVRDCLQLRMLRHRMDNGWQVKPLQHQAVLLEQQLEELSQIMAHAVHLQPFDDARALDRFIADRFGPRHFTTFAGVQAVAVRFAAYGHATFAQSRRSG